MRIIYYGQDPLPTFINPVITVGTFDGLHTAHLKIISKLIESATSIHGESILISFHPHPRSIVDGKDHNIQLLTTLEERIKLLEETDLDYFVIVPFDYSFSMLMPQEYIELFLIRNFKPSKIIAGYDHRFGKDGRGDCALLKEYADQGYFQYEEIEAQTSNISLINSTQIRNSLFECKIVEANELLGYPYMFSGNVVPGNQMGRKLGFPTANIEILNNSKLIPPDGIYAALCLVRGLHYEGMLYIGKSETTNTHFKRTIEIHLFDFVQEIYGEQITVYILEYIRNDKKYESIEKLKLQIQKDEVKIKNAILKYKIHNRPLSKATTAIAILNYNGVRFLQEYLPSIVQFCPKGMVIYIIDNNSTDSSCIFVEQHFPEIQLVRLRRNYGFASGYNKGLAQINADYFVLLNSDVLVKQDWISAIIEKMQTNPAILVMQPKILSLKEPHKFEYAGAAGGYLDVLGYPFCKGRIIDYIEEDLNQYDEEDEIFWASGAAMVIKAAAFKAMGGFDPDYFAHQEEIDLCWRLKRIGGSIRYFPNSVVYHLGGGTLDYDNPRKTYLNFRNNLFTIFKNSSWLQLIAILPVRLVLDFLISISYLFKGKFIVFFRIIQAYIISIINTIYLVHKKRHTDQLIMALQYKPFKKKGILKASIFLQYYFSGNKLFSSIPKQYFKK
ncbi:MAG: riboflavin biosynthesis protein RibF [Saprospiraceae bacterium]|nr:riboflavin biosynthesis protein RibF [Saprospiraceae bacterium]